MEDKEFDRLLKITRLRVSDEERVQLKKDFEQVVAYFDEISSVEASGEPAYHPVEVPGRLREDIIKPVKNPIRMSDAGFQSLVRREIEEAKQVGKDYYEGGEW